MAPQLKGTILHLIDTGGHGGAETIFLRIATGIAARGWRSLPVVNREGWLAKELRRSALEPVIINSKGSLNLPYLARLTDLVRREKPELILTHLYGSAVYGAIVGHIMRRPVISVLHGQSDISDTECFSFSKARIVASGSTQLVAVSTALRVALAERIPATPARWSVIPNGVDTATLIPGGSIGLRQQVGVTEKTCLVGALGNIRRPKAYDVFLRVAARLTEQDPDYLFFIAGQGSGKLLDELLTLRETLGLEDKVHFLGMETNVRGYLGELDVFLSTSSTEGFSIACVEAMACGLPVVTTRSGGPQDIVLQGRTGFLANVGAVEELAAAVAKLAENPNLRTNMGKAGRTRAEKKFSLSSMLNAYERLIEQATTR